MWIEVKNLCFIFVGLVPLCFIAILIAVPLSVHSLYCNSAHKLIHPLTLKGSKKLLVVLGVVR